jgi:hypothetical protein
MIEITLIGVTTEKVSQLKMPLMSIDTLKIALKKKSLLFEHHRQIKK